MKATIVVLLLASSIARADEALPETPTESRCTDFLALPKQHRMMFLLGFWAGWDYAAKTLAKTAEYDDPKSDDLEKREVKKTARVCAATLMTIQRTGKPVTYNEIEARTEIQCERNKSQSVADAWIASITPRPLADM